MRRLKWLWPLLLPMVLQAQDKHRLSEATVDSVLVYYRAISYCNEQDQITTRFQQGYERDSLVVVHEAKHREQMARFPDCAASVEWAQENVLHRMDAEAEAYCASVDWAVRHGAEKNAMKSEYLIAIFRGFRGLIPPATILDALNRYCP